MCEISAITYSPPTSSVLQAERFDCLRVTGNLCWTVSVSTRSRSTPGLTLTPPTGTWLSSCPASTSTLWTAGGGRSVENWLSSCSLKTFFFLRTEWRWAWLGWEGCVLSSTTVSLGRVSASIYRLDRPIWQIFPNLISQFSELSCPLVLRRLGWPTVAGSRIQVPGSPGKYYLGLTAHWERYPTVCSWWLMRSATTSGCTMTTM